MKPLLDGTVPSTIESKTQQGFCQLMVMEKEDVYCYGFFFLSFFSCKL
jgi:hypothetical protein